MKVLIACEESQTVCKAFREKGHEAYSCDIIECSGGHPEWHIKQDVLPLLNGKCEFVTEDGQAHSIKGKWELIIAHPPCTYLCMSGQKHCNVEIYGEKAHEIDVSDKSIEETRDLILEIVAGNLESPLGSIDFMEWFLE